MKLFNCLEKIAIIFKSLLIKFRNKINYFIHILKYSFDFILRKIIFLITGPRIFFSTTYKNLNNINYINQPIFDLTNLNFPKNPVRIKLLTFSFGSDINDDELGIASLVFFKDRAYHYIDFFIKDMNAAIKSNKFKSDLIIDDPVYLFPYSTNHFGHFTGECLGAIITFSKIIPDENRKLYVIAPKSFEKLILKYGYSNKIVFLSSKLALKNNFIFNNAKLLPRISPWQNLSLSQQIFESLPEYKVKYKRVFLTSCRPSRIYNILEVIDFLKNNDFFILNPLNHSFEETLSIIKQCDELISESGSITLNIILSRRKHYYILSSPNSLRLGLSEFAGGGIFNSFQFIHAQHVICPLANTNNSNSYHAYSSQVNVDILILQKIIDSMN